MVFLHRESGRERGRGLRGTLETTRSLSGDRGAMRTVFSDLETAGARKLLCSYHSKSCARAQLGRGPGY